MNWNIRPARPEEDAAVAAVLNQSTLFPMTVTMLRERNAGFAQHGPCLQLVAADVTDQVLAIGSLFHDPWRPADELELFVAVTGPAQGQSIGSSLYAALERQAIALGARVAGTHVRDDRESSRDFAARRGYAVTDHYRRSRQDLAQFDPALFWHYVEQAEAAGYRFITLAEADADGPRRLFALDMACAKDEPGLGGGPEALTFEQYALDMLTGVTFDPAGIFIAEQAGEWVAMSGLRFPPEQTEAGVVFTGVLPAHRGRGLAQALKTLCAVYAKRRGRRWIVTGNHEANPAMLAINRKFGFVPSPGSLVMRKQLQIGQGGA